jgi:copper chaperone NosL
MKSMKLQSRILMAMGAVMLIALYYMPFWSISMSAPQYPEGIGMYIHIDDVRGHNRHDLQSINTLNHYIGMAEIHKEDFYEFEIMPWIIGFLIVFGLIAAAIGNIKIVITWLVLMILLGAVGLVDFYLWGYDYGHNLSPDAPIKVPGMSYQPPLLGCKQLLNIKACSWPYTGSIFIGLSMVFAAGVVWIEKYKKQ